jgi:hypothetical protein
MRYFSTIPLVFLLILGSTFRARAQYDDEAEWVRFGFDMTSYRWEEEGKKVFDLKSGTYVTFKYMKSHDGHYVQMSGFTPDWITLTISGTNVLFSSDLRNDSKVDAKARQLSDYVSVHYGNSYVAAFGRHTYTIRLLEGAYSLGESYAEFAYHKGGTPEPKPKATKPKNRKAQRPPKPVPGQIQTLDVVIQMPSSDESQIFYEADLIVEFTGAAHFMTTYYAVSADGRTRTVTFHDIPAGTYNLEVIWADKDVVQSVVVHGAASRIDLVFD